MGNITKSSATEQQVKDLGLQSAQGIPTVLSNTVQPVVKLGQWATTVHRTVAGVATGDTSIYTCDDSPDKDFYVTGFWIAYSYDAANTGTSISIRGFVDGLEQDLYQLRKAASVAGGTNGSISFKYPLKIDRGTLLDGRATYGAGTGVAVFGVYGFYA